MIRKRYRVTIDVDVTMDEITMDWALERLARRAAAARDIGCGPFAEDPPPKESDVAAQRMLQEHLLRMPEHMDAWLKNELLFALPDYVARDDLRDTPEQILTPVIERLPPRERHWWRQSLRSDNDAEIDRAEQFFDAVGLELGSISVSAIEDPA